MPDEERDTRKNEKEPYQCWNGKLFHFSTFETESRRALKAIEATTMEVQEFRASASIQMTCLLLRGIDATTHSWPEQRTHMPKCLIELFQTFQAPTDYILRHKPSLPEASRARARFPDSRDPRDPRSSRPDTHPHEAHYDRASQVETWHGRQDGSSGTNRPISTLTPSFGLHPANRRRSVLRGAENSPSGSWSTSTKISIFRPSDRSSAHAITS